MDMINELNEATAQGINGFREFLQQKLQSNKHYLEQKFWVNGGLQMTVLNYLIQQHQEKPPNSKFKVSAHDKMEMIDYVLAQSVDMNMAEPLHQAVAENKIQLARHLLAQNSQSKVSSKCFDVSRRDEYGRTLLALVIMTRDEDLLSELLSQNPNVNEASRVPGWTYLFQPMHLAVLQNDAFAITLLAKQGAQLSNPAGPFKETPVLMAARLGKMTALQTLLNHPNAQLQLEAENLILQSKSKRGHTAMEVLCKNMAAKKHKGELIYGVAMLLCAGAEPPRDEKMRKLLRSNRQLLLKAIHRYLQNKPELVDAFVQRCHKPGTVLHKIVYANHSFGSAMRRLFAQPSDVAFIVEDLVSRKYKTSLKGQTSKSQGSQNAIQLYAEFVRRYQRAFDGQKNANRQSTMRWMIIEGRANWEMVLLHAKLKPSSRTNKILKEMFPDEMKTIIERDEILKPSLRVK